jgi:hypothetical protein
MKKQKFQIALFILLALGMSYFSCKPDSFTEEDAMNLQNQLELNKMHLQDSLDAAKSNVTFIISLVDAAKTSMLKSTNSLNGVTGAAVTVGQNNVLVTKTTDASGVLLFDNLKRGRATLHITLTGYAEINAVLDFDKAGPDTTSSGRQVGVVLPMFALTGSSTGTIKGTITCESDLTNKTPEPVPTGTKVIATVDESSASLAGIKTDIIVSINYDNLSVEGTTDASGNYTLTVPGASQGLSYSLKVSDFVANQNLLMLTKNGVAVTGVQTVPTNFGSTFSSGSSAIPTVSPVIVTFSAPDYTYTPAIATAVLTAGVVTSITVNNQGDGYISGKVAVVISGPGNTGTTATASATVTDGKITAITVNTGGSQYITVPTVTVVSKVEKIQAKATANVNSEGSITSFTINNAGGGYLATPTVTITPAVPSAGSGASAVATVAAGIVSSMTLLTGGSGYVGFNTPTTLQNAPSATYANIKGTGTTIVNIHLGTGLRTIPN